MSHYTSLFQFVYNKPWTNVCQQKWYNNNNANINSLSAPLVYKYNNGVNCLLFLINSFVFFVLFSDVKWR